MCSSHNRKYSNKTWHKYRIVIKPQTSLWPQEIRRNQALAKGGPIYLPDVDSAINQGTGIKYSGSYGTQVGVRKPNIIYHPPMPLLTSILVVKQELKCTISKTMIISNNKHAARLQQLWQLTTRNRT